MLQFTTKGICRGPDTLTLTEDKAVFDGKSCCYKIHEEVVISEIRFFDNRGSRIHFGYKDQIMMKGLKKEEIQQIRSHLESRGAKLGQGAAWVKKGCGNCCCPSDSIALVEDGVMHRFQKGGKSQSSFVAWDKTNVATFPRGRLPCGKFIVMLGELDIVTQKKFPGAMISEIKRQLEAKGIKSEESSEIYRPFLFKHCKEHFNNAVILTKEGVVAKMSKRAVGKSSLPADSGKGAGRTIYIPYKNITRIGSVKGLKGYFEIEGTIIDLRTRIPAAVRIVMLKPCLCSWCSLKGKVKSRMKG
jgi:hypothetical protein